MQHYSVTTRATPLDIVSYHLAALPRSIAAPAARRGPIFPSFTEENDTLKVNLPYIVPKG